MQGERIIHLPSEMRRVAAELLGSLRAVSGATVLALEGDLGAGKTAFVQGLAAALGVAEEPVSPTFMLARSYDTAHPVFRRLVHMDVYRLAGPADLDAVGWYAYLADPATLVAVEWADRIRSAVPAGAHWIHFIHHDEQTRHLRFA